MDEEYIACAEIVRKGDPDRFMSVMAAPVEARAPLFALYACNVEIARAPWVTQETMIAEMRLQWWRDVMGEIKAHGAVRKHEVVTPLAKHLDPKTAELFDALIAARRWDIYKKPFEDEAHLFEYLDRSAAALLYIAATTLGPVPESTIRDAGFALGVANWLRAVPALEKSGRVPLVDGTPQGVRHLAEAGLDRLASARKSRAEVSRAARPAMLCLWQTGALLEIARRTPGRVADGSLELAPFRRRASLMMCAATGRW